MTISEAEAQRITAYLDISAPTTHADLAFVLGTRLPEPAQIALELYQTEVVPVIVLTGGNNRITGEPEAATHQALLRAAGVPDDHLIVETASTNTLENVVLALPLIRTRLDLDAVRSVLVIAKWMHARRAVMTLKRHFPPGVRYYTRTYNPEGITPKNWFQDEQRAARVLKNWQSIPRYLALDHIAEVELVDGAYM